MRIVYFSCVITPLLLIIIITISLTHELTSTYLSFSSSRGALSASDLLRQVYLQNCTLCVLSRFVLTNGVMSIRQEDEDHTLGKGNDHDNNNIDCNKNDVSMMTMTTESFIG